MTPAQNVFLCFTYLPTLAGDVLCLSLTPGLQRRQEIFYLPAPGAIPLA